MITAAQANYISSGKQEKDKLFDNISKKITKIAINKENYLTIMFNCTHDRYNKDLCINIHTDGYYESELSKIISSKLKENGFIVEEAINNKNTLNVSW